MFSSSDSSKEQGIKPAMSVDVPAHTLADGSFTLSPGNSGQSLFTSPLKETSTKIPSAGIFPVFHNTDDKEKTSIFGKSPPFCFSNTSGTSAPEVTPFQVKNISIGLSTSPSTTSVVTVCSSQSSVLAKPVASFKNVTGASDSTVSLFTTSPVFSLPGGNAGPSLLAPKDPITKIETSFSFAETFKKETMEKSELQPEQQSTSVFGKPPAFSFSSAAASIMPDNKVSDQSSSFSTAFHGSSGSLPIVSNIKDQELHSSKGEHKAETEVPTKEVSSKISPVTTTNKTLSSVTSSKPSLQITSSNNSPRMIRASPETMHIRSRMMSSKSADGMTSKTSSGNTGSNTIRLHRDSRGSSSMSSHTVKDNGNSVIKKAKHRREVSTTKIKKKSKDDESKTDNKTSGLLTPEEIQKLTSIMCKGIHPDLNHRSDLIKYFSKFGQIKKITCSTRYCHAIVTFVTHEAARKAKRLGSIISPNYKPVEIFWYTQTSKASDEKKPIFQSEVHDELESMMEIDAHAVLARPAEHQSPKSLKTNTSSRKRNEKSDLKDSKHSEKVKSSKISDSNEDSLKELLGMPAFTEEEKYHVLNARDKLMRLNLQKQSDISKAKAVVGICPDICSEKERYSRFGKKCLSVYEQKKTFDPSVTAKCLDHRIIVKEYSRSSADKEEPLPHEIRPTHVLSLTLDHLMCNVANRVTDSSLSVGEWYDFIWNRTRAIRKDIVQQDLCSIECVKLVEKCVRFHIHCAAVLCEEDMAVFDPKINDENLTKSLQTLKHMYHDLALNGIKCFNEAEFRAYDILLSLNEGDTLRQAQNFSSEIRESPEVRFAVSAAFAVNSNNYSRFFKLVEEASYLNACIMHRYFTPVRARALLVMLKAYCLPNHTEMYPLEELVKVLKFESVSEAVQFCQWLGFQTDENHVQLDRMSSVESSSSTFVTRSINLVEKKCSVPVGEVMNKGPLPVNPLVSYEPHCSFDCNGYLRKEAYDASDQKLKAEQGNKTVTVIIIQPEPVSKEDNVVPVTKPVIIKYVDSSPKQETHSDHYLAIDTSLPPSSTVSQAAEIKSASANTDLPEEIKRASVNKDLAVEIKRTSVNKDLAVEIKRTSVSKDLAARVKRSSINKDLAAEIKKASFHKDSASGIKRASVNKDLASGIKRASVNKDLAPEIKRASVNKDLASEIKRGSINKDLASEIKRRPINKDLASEIKRRPINKDLATGTALPITNEKKRSVSTKEQVFQSFPNVSQEKVRPAADLHNAKVLQYTSNIWELLSSEVIENYAHEIASNECEAEIACIKLRDSFIDEVVKDSCFKVSCDVIRDVTKEEMATCEIEKRKSKYASSLTEEVILEIVQEHVSSFVKHEYVEARAKMLDAACNSMVTTIFENCISNLVTSVADEVHRQEKNAWQHLVQAAKRKTQLHQAKKALIKWRRAYMKRRKLEICRDTFPCSPQVPLKVNSAASECENVLSKVKKEEELSKLLDAGVILSNIKQEFSWLPLDLAGLFEKRFSKLEANYSPNPKKMCWKLLLLVPENCGSDDNSSWTSFIHWFCAKFHREKFHSAFEDGMILCDMFEEKCHGCHIDICVRAVLLGSKDFPQNLEVMKKKKLLEGTSAVFLLMPHYKMKDVVHEEILNQVQQIFNTKQPFPPVPLYCFIVGSKDFQIPPAVTQVLNSLRKKLILCDYKVSNIDDTTQYWKSSEELLEATAWLLEQYREVPALISCSLKDFVEDGFLKIFSFLFEELSCPTSPLKVQNPSKMITFYNSVICDYAEAVCSSVLSKISWPPPEVIRSSHVSEPALGWNELENLNKIRTALTNIHLPEFHGSAVDLDDLWTYVGEVANIGGSNSCNFFSSIQSFLLKNEHSVGNNSFIPWSDVVYDCAHYLISCQSFMDESTKKELQVAYASKDLDYIDLKLKWKLNPQEDEIVLNDKNIFVKKRKHCAQEVHESLQCGDACLSDILEHSPLKYARSEKEDEEQGLTFEESSQTTYQQYNTLSVTNSFLCGTERKSLLLMEALAAEKCQSESYLALLEAKVAEGQSINEGTFDETFLEEDCDDELEGSSVQSCNRRPDSNIKEELPIHCTSAALNKSLEELKDRLRAQQKANESYERQLREFM